MRHFSYLRTDLSTWYAPLIEVPVTCFQPSYHKFFQIAIVFNPLKADLNPIRHLLALLGARHILHVSRIRVN
jgi:hypothetical protein